MSATLFLLVMTSSFFNPSFAFSSHFDSVLVKLISGRTHSMTFSAPWTDGAPLSELSWSSSLAVVAVSFSGLFTFIFLMLACLCCKKGEIGFKEFENAEGEEYHTDLSTLNSPVSQSSADIYILPLSDVSLPASQQPPPSIQLLKPTEVGRRSLLYVKELGHGWFGKVLLGEVNSGSDSKQVVIKELRASASVQDQIHFLEEAQPYRVLLHPGLLQCLAQCTETTPYLLIMEFCPLGDLKGYLRSCRAADSMTPDPLILQRMACEISSGLLQMHKHNFIHSDLALRNCLLTSDLTVKIGDYGFSHSKYKEDYFVTPDQLWVPLRWIGPELIDEVHGNLLLVDQTKPSNIWSLGVSLWEMFELGNQPYRHYSDQQVLTYALKEQQLRLPKPLLDLPLSNRWYEVMQFCWLPPEQRPNAEEVHLLLAYLCARGASQAEDDFEKRWNSLRPNGGPAPPPVSSFPLLQHLPQHPEPGDDVLTITQTSRGLNFECRWEQARTQPSGGPRYPTALGLSPSYYQPQPLPLRAPSPSLGSEYYLRLEYPSCPYSPEGQGSSGSASFLTGSGDSGECLGCPALPQPDSYWSADIRKAAGYDWDSSPALSLTAEPLLGGEPCCSPAHSWETGPAHPCSSPAHPWDIGPAHPCSSPAHPGRLWETGRYVSYKDRDGGYYYEPPASLELDPYLTEPPQESWGSRSLRQALGELENPLGISPSICSPALGYHSAPYLQSKTTVTGAACYYSTMEPLWNTMPRVARGGSHHHANPQFTPPGWASNRSANNNSLQSHPQPPGATLRHLHYTMPPASVEDSWPLREHMGSHSPLPTSRERHAHPHLRPEAPRLHTEEGPQFIDPLTGVMVRSYACHQELEKSLPPAPRVGAVQGGVVLRGQAWAPHPGAPGEPASDSGVDPGSSSISLVELCDCSDDDDITDITSGVFGDVPARGSDSGERGTPNLSPVQKQAGTPDSIESIELHPSPDPLPPTPHSSAPFPPPLDSGYDTENNESPEFVLKEPPDLRETGGSAPPSGKPAPSDADVTPPPVTELQLCENRPYRDSAYFSDCETEGGGTTLGVEPVPITPPEELCSLETVSELLSQSQEEESPAERPAPSASAQRTVGAELLHGGPASEWNRDAMRLDEKKQEAEERGEEKEMQVVKDMKEEEVEEEKEVKKVEEGEIVNEVEWVAEEVEEEADEVKEEVVVKKDIKEAGEVKEQEKEEVEEEVETDVKEENEIGEEVEDIKEEVEVMIEEDEQDDGDMMTEAELVMEEQEEVKKEENAAEMQEEEEEDIMAEVEMDVKEVKGVKEGEVRDEVKEEEKVEIDVMTEVKGVKEGEIRDEVKEEEKVEMDVMTEVKGVKEGEIREEVKEDTPGALTEEAFGGVGLSPLGGRVSPGAGEEGDSEDSEGSDEEVHSHSALESEEEDPEECKVVPLVVSDGRHACHLRSVLRSLSPTQERKAKTVSFFSDVTVYLFDQESPTQELAEPGLPVGAEPGPEGPAAPPNQERVSDDSSDGNLSEESGGLEWEDDFPLLPSPSLMMSSPEVQPARFSGFSVSRFSLTHVSDSDMDSAGGSSEDGERE